MNILAHPGTADQLGNLTVAEVAIAMIISY